MVTKKAETEVAVPEVVDETPSVMDLNKFFHVEDSFVPESFAELEDYFEGAGGLVEFQGSVYDIVQKSTLVGVPFAIVDIRFYKGSYGDACAVMCLVEDEDSGRVRRVVFNDGSTGIYRQCLNAVTRNGRRGGFACPRGLRRSDYTYQETDFDGQPIGDPRPASTYYIA